MRPHLLKSLQLRSRRALWIAAAALGIVLGVGHAQVNQSINQSVWKMFYRVTDSQINESGADAGWLGRDDDGDGLTNGAELAAGTDPFKSNSILKVSTLTADASNVYLTVPTMAGKLYVVQANTNVANTSGWANLSPNVQVVGDGNNDVLTVPKPGVTTFYRVVVQDTDTSGDQVGDWAQRILGFAENTGIGSQSGFDANSLASMLQTQNVVTVSTVNGATTQPGDMTPVTNGFGTITVTRSGYLLFSSITVPLTIGGDAALNTDYTISGNEYNAGTTSVTFPQGVRSVTLTITPAYNPNRNSPGVMTVTANPSGGYAIGSPATAGVTIYPSGKAVGTGLTGAYYSTASSTYGSAANLGSLQASYTYAVAGSPSTALQGTISVTYSGTRTLAVGEVVTMSFTSGTLLASGVLPSGTTGPLYDRAYVVKTSVTSPSKVVTLELSGTNAPAAQATLANCFITGYNSPTLTRVDPTVDFTYNSGVPATTSLPVSTSDNWTARFDSYIRPSKTSSVTISQATPALITWTAHGLAAGTPVTFSTTGTLPAGLTTGTTYYVISTGLTTNAFQVSTSVGGTAVATTTAGSGSHTAEAIVTGNYTFDIQANDAARVYLDTDSNGTLDLVTEKIIDAWAPGSSTFTPMASAAVSLTTGTRYRIRVEYLELNNNASVTLRWKRPGDASFASIPAANAFQDATTSTPGWIGQYWANTSFAGQPRFADYPASIVQNWGTGAPSQTIPGNDNYSIRWEGYVSSASGQTYNFNVTADDTAAIYIDLDGNGDFSGPGETVIAPSASATSGDVTLAAGARYKIRVDYVETTGTGSLNVGWRVGTSGGFSAFNASAAQTGTGLTIYRDATTSAVGWFASYFTTNNFTAPPFYSTQDTSATSLVANYGSTKPGGSGLTTGGSGNDNWGSRIEAYVKEPGTGGTYQFETYVQPGGNDFARLLVNDVEQIGFNSGVTAPVTISQGTPGIITWANHGLLPNQTVIFTSNGTLPTGLVAGTTYFVTTANLTTNTFTVSASSGASTGIQTTSAGSGTHTAYAQSSAPYTVALTAGQVVKVTLEHYNLSGNANPGLAWKKPGDTTFALIPAANLYRDSGATVAGVTASYFGNTALYGPANFVNYPTQVNLAATSGVPSQSFTFDNFSARWETYIRPTSGGTISFDIQADDTARVYLDVDRDGNFGAGELIIDASTPGVAAVTPMASTSYTLVGGLRYKLRVDFTDSADAAVAKLRWQGDGTNSMASISNGVLYLTDTTSQLGVFCSYYANTTLTDPPLYTVVENNNPGITYDFGSGRPPGTPVSPVTISIGTPGVVTWPSHGLAANTPVLFLTSGALPTGLAAGTTYYVVASGLTPNSFAVSSTLGGTAITTSGTQSGNHYAGTIGYDNFTVRWTGQILPQYSETYFIDGRNDDGVRIWVNNQLIVNRWPGSSVTDSTGTIALQAGTRYDIVMDYYEATGTSEIHLYWWSDSQAKQIIPMSRLFPTPTGVTPTGGNPAPAKPAITSPATAVALVGTGGVFTYTITASNGGGNFTATGLPPGITLNSATGVLSGTATQAGTYLVTVTATNAAGTSSSVVTITVVSSGGQYTRDQWSTAANYLVFNGTPDSHAEVTVTGLEDNNPYADNSAQRLRGYIVPPADGNYYFYLAANNAAELWISTNKEPINIFRRARVTADTGIQTWNTQATQKSPWLKLVGGQRYYYEVRHLCPAGSSSDYVAVGYQLDATGNGAILANTTGVVPPAMLAPFDYPATTAVGGSLYTTTLTPVSGVTTTASGYAFARLNQAQTSAVLHCDYGGLTSGAIGAGVYAANGTSLFDVYATEKFHPELKTADGGYNWTVSGPALAALQATNGAYFLVKTSNYPNGEVVGFFTFNDGSQVPPSVPGNPTWTDDSGTDVGAVRFLTQASYGASQADINALKALPASSNFGGRYRTWIDNQFAVTPSLVIPDILANLSSNTMSPYPEASFFNAWWKNALVAPDQLRQRFAFALSEILVTSNQGPLNNNARILGDYYDTLVEYGLPTAGRTGSGNFRSLLKQVTLTPAMGLYLDMLNNDKGDISVGRSANENYAREIMQLFSIGLYRLWPDGSLMLDSQGSPIPTYTQEEIKGLAKVFTGWTYGQPVVSGRLPTGWTGAQNFLDPMLLVPTHHDLTAKLLLYNIVFPPSTGATDSVAAGQGVTVQSYDPNVGQGTLISTEILNKADLYGLKELDLAHDIIAESSSVGPYICRQLIQRLVTSHPKPEYVYRVVQAFNGERNVDGVATGVRGDMQDVLRAILLDYEARSTTAAADNTFGKQREPLMRVVNPARAFLASSLTGSYAQTEFVDTATPPHYNESANLLTITSTAHRLGNGENILLNFSTVNSGGVIPSSQANYQVSNPQANTFTVGATGWDTGVTWKQNNGVSDSVAGTVVTVTNRGWSTSVSGNDGYKVGARIYVKFLRNGDLATNTTTSNDVPADGLYTVASNPTTGSFTFNVSTSALRVNVNPTTGNRLMIAKLGGGYTITANPNTSDQNDIIISCATTGRHDLAINDHVWLDFTGAPTPVAPADGEYVVNSIIDEDHFTVLGSGASATSWPNLVVYPLVKAPLVRNGNVGIQQSTYNMTNTTTELNQSPMNSTTVFNFYYPDFKYPGNSPLALSGITVPEFQLTTDSNLVLMQNFLNQGFLQAGNANGYTSFKGGSGAIVMDLAAYSSADVSTVNGVNTLIDSLNTLLCAGQLTSATKDAIRNYILYDRTITSVTAASPAVFTMAGHGLTAGEVVTITGISGGTWSGATTNPNSALTVRTVTADTFTLWNGTTNLNLTGSPTLTSSHVVLFPSASGTNQRDRVRAIIHLLISSPDYAIQK